MNFRMTFVDSVVHLRRAAPDQITSRASADYRNYRRQLLPENPAPQRCRICDIFVVTVVFHTPKPRRRRLARSVSSDPTKSGAAEKMSPADRGSPVRGAHASRVLPPASRRGRFGWFGRDARTPETWKTANLPPFPNGPNHGNWPNSRVRSQSRPAFRPLQRRLAHFHTGIVTSGCFGQCHTSASFGECTILVSHRGQLGVE
jgi:hypothetical protein